MESNVTYHSYENPPKNSDLEVFGVTYFESVARIENIDGGESKIAAETGV